MVINYLNSTRAIYRPHKTDSPLIIDANAVLSGAIALELLKTIAGRRPQIIERFSCIHHDELPEHCALKIARITPHRLAEEQPFSVLVAEALDHLSLIHI